MFMRKAVVGEACVEAAFPGADVAGLREAAAQLRAVYPSAVAETLLASVNSRRWKPARTAIGGLRKQGRAGMWTAPAIAGWLKLRMDEGVHEEESYAISDALFALTEMRPLLGEYGCEPMERFLDDVFQPYLLTLLAPPVRYWQRAIVGYLEREEGDLEAVAARLQTFVVAVREETSDWDQYTHAEILRLLGEIGPKLERLGVERKWRTERRPEPIERPVDWLIAELAAPSVERRIEACRAVRRLGAADAMPALLALAKELESAPENVVEQLREEAMAAMLALAPEPQREATPVTHRLLVLAAQDPNPSVRATALAALAEGPSTPEALDIALQAAESDDPDERAAGVRLLARLNL
ncbi:HEAT repeat domain-containing protein [Kutzneria buriramensis]|uniref:HEAT repeat protein n=1 Tax=Kutzneria buriramensis TaxID=1045776 RepID=A0A3E0GVK7_9PSEU|nr:HEAT repeat domain-containing protein [Kutzneria buriramensis]REH30721.1 hypothetical protein BCF44_12380 [Kutzneria buriramensis]